MLKICSLNKSFNNKVVLNDINFNINSGDVVALIGSNGSGKSTLLKVILGVLPQDSGTIIRNGHFGVGFVAQEPVNRDRKVTESFGILPNDWQIDIALEKVGLPDSVKLMPVNKLSGGQQTRLAFAQVLAIQPSPKLLLLDEPTNNLDLAGLLWLENFIKNFSGAVILVSHEREFINNTATMVCNLEDTKLKIYKGNYDEYAQEYAKETETELKNYQLYLQEKKKVEKLISKAKDRSKNGVRSNKPPDNDKSLWTFKNENVQKSLSGTAKALETRLAKLEVVEKPSYEKRHHIEFDAINARKKLILRLENISKSFKERQLFNELNLEVRGNDRVIINGINGSGKSTLLKIAYGTVIPDKGQVICGEKISLGYYSQTIDGLDFEISGLENILNKNMSQTEAYSQAAAMGLKPADLTKCIKELSVGQRAKLSFVKLLAEDYNLLILDEPTNHLDIVTKEAIEAALSHYKGAILLASHDSYFVNKLSITHQVEIGSN
jgi:ATPase subunit of ABC transporter with duplicated ATPase domains